MTEAQPRSASSSSRTASSTPSSSSTRSCSDGLAIESRRVEGEREFCAALVEFAPDIIISDLSMPDFSGYRALELARERVPDTPFLFVSGTMGEEAAVEAVRRGATDYVLKHNLARLRAVVPPRAARSGGARGALAGREKPAARATLRRAGAARIGPQPRSAQRAAADHDGRVDAARSRRRAHAQDRSARCRIARRAVSTSSTRC